MLINLVLSISFFSLLIFLAIKSEKKRQKAISQHYALQARINEKNERQGRVGFPCVAHNF